MTAKTPAQLKAEAASSFPDNTTGLITPAIMRSFQDDIIDSFSSGSTINVADYGAVGDGLTDDRPAIQAALNALKAAGGGTLELISGKTHLLNSYANSTDPNFHYNLIADSNTIISGNGATLLQGSSGRAPNVGVSVVNPVLAFAKVATYPAITFQDPALNGGFYSLNAITANDTIVTFSSISDVAHFSQGDLVGIYSATTGDVIMSEMSEVISVNAGAGQITLKWRLARSMATPSIANVTALAITNIKIRDVTLQGAIPLYLLQCFDVESEEVNYVTDVSIADSNTLGLYINTVRGLSSEGDTYSSVGVGTLNIQLPQRNSMDITYTDCTFEASSVGFGEFSAHWTLQNNIINIFGPNGLILSGLDILFEGNSVYAADISTPGLGIICDDAGGGTLATSGQIRIVHNIIVGTATGNQAIKVATIDAVIASNVIVLSGNANGVKVESTEAQKVAIVENNITLGSSGTFGVWIVNNVDPHGCTVAANTLIGTGGGTAGILVLNGDGIARTGGHTISSNTIAGFTTSVVVVFAESPGTIVLDRSFLHLPPGCFIEGVEQTAPSAPAANGYRIYAQDNGGGKTQLMVLFNTGAAQQIAIQP